MAKTKIITPPGSLRLRPSVIREGPLKLLVTAKPRPEEVQEFLALLKKYGVKHLVRVTSATYSTKEIEAAGIRVHTWPYNNGDGPDESIAMKFLNLSKRFIKSGDEGFLAVHCDSGLGRGPVMAAMALIANGVDADEAIERIRESRKGAINKRQEQYLKDFQKKFAKKCTIL
eukprot:m.36390 g.36390  ORF g.36390 m.36390 type:complete len:172 (+) comp9102_c0_seq1:285-800(+)